MRGGRLADVDSGSVPATSTSTAFRELLETRRAHIGIVGLGYAGLPLAMAFAEAGFRVTGVDTNPERVADVNAGRSYLVDVPDERYAAIEGRLQATTDVSAVTELDVLTICVPTPLSKTRSPDLTYVVAAAEAVAEHTRPEQLVILQSTTYPGTTEDVLKPMFERRGLTVGEDVFLGYAPERVDPGNRRWNLRNTPKLVAGITTECRERTRLVYETVVDDVVPLRSTTVAELAKLHENTFRAVNIALANELALMCDRLGVSAWEVIDAAATKPFAFMPHYPGPGLGGDCIPVVPHFLSWRLREYGYSNRLVEAAHEVNAAMPLHVIQKVADALNDHGRAIKGARLLLLGAAYKPDVHDTRESPSLEVMRQLLHRGGDVVICDPWVDGVALDGVEHAPVPWSAEEVERADVVVMLTPHTVFLDEPHWRAAKLVVDTRNVIPDDQPELWRI
jgi:UDP-N-acetyl-D-glucosamine dehydrogenase